MEYTIVQAQHKVNIGAGVYGIFVKGVENFHWLLIPNDLILIHLGGALGSHF